MIYYSVHTLELIHFDFETQQSMKKQLYPSDAYPSDASNFPPLHWSIPQIF